MLGNIVHALHRDEKERRKRFASDPSECGRAAAAPHRYMHWQCPESRSQSADMYTRNSTTLVLFSPLVISFPFDAIIRPTFTHGSTLWVNPMFQGIAWRRRRYARNIRSLSKKKTYNLSKIHFDLTLIYFS